MFAHGHLTQQRDDNSQKRRAIIAGRMAKAMKERGDSENRSKSVLFNFRQDVCHN